jgi:transposase InsO family protein
VTHSGSTARPSRLDAWDVSLVPRSFRIDPEEFWSRQRLDSFGEAEATLRTWEHHYNTERFSMALRGEIPAERLPTKLAA